RPRAPAAAASLQAPAQSATGAGLGWRVRFERLAEIDVGRPGPDFAQALLGGVAERVILVATLRKRRDAARQSPPVGGEIHHRPWPAAQRPGRARYSAVIAALETDARLRGAARGAEVDAERAGERGGAVDVDRFLTGQLLVERLVRPGEADGLVGEKHQPLQMHFLDAGLRRDTDEIRQLLDGFAQAGEPGRNLRLEMALALLQLAEGTDVFQDAMEIVLAANGEIRLRVGRVAGDAQLVQFGGDQGTAVFLVEHRAVGVEQNIGAAIFQIAHHARQMLDQHGLADAVQHGALQVRYLIDNRGKQLPAHIGRRLELLIGARA